VIWFSVNARLDGVDPGSANPMERLKYLVYQRRLLLEALKTKALLLALIDNKEAAAKVATSYFEMVIPEGKMAKLERDAALSARLAEIEAMGPQEMRAITTEELIRREQARLDELQKAAGKAKPTRAPQQRPLTGAALAKHLNETQGKKQPIANVRFGGRRSPPRRPR
jgi:hypothetical protein